MRCMEGAEQDVAFSSFSSFLGLKIHILAVMALLQRTPLNPLYGYIASQLQEISLFSSQIIGYFLSCR